jgi:hypothetical protein
MYADPALYGDPAIEGALTPIEAAHVLYVMNGQEGMEPGSFTTSLITTIAKADPINKAKLAKGFPGYVTAVDLYQNAPHGVEVLRIHVMKMGDGQ